MRRLGKKIKRGVLTYALVDIAVFVRSVEEKSYMMIMMRSNRYIS